MKDKSAIRTQAFMPMFLMMSCMAFSIYGGGRHSVSGMQATVDKAGTALARTATEQIKAGRDSAAAATSMQLYDLDNEANIEWLVKAGDAFSRMGRWEEAKSAFVKYLDKKNGAPEVAAKLACAEYGLANFARAIELFKQVPSLVESQEHLTMVAAESYFATGAYDEVLSLLPEQKLSKNRRGLELAATSSEKMGEFEKALLFSEKLLAVTPAQKRLEISLRIAGLYEQTGKADKAKKTYETIIADFPSDMRSYERLSRIFMAGNSWREAQALLERAARAPGSGPWVQRMLGQCCSAQADRNAAVNHYRLYLAKEPADSAAWYELGLVYYGQEHYAEAADALKKSVALTPKNTRSLDLLGECLVKTNDVRSAAAVFERSRLIAKKDVIVLSRLAACYRQLHDAHNLMSVVRDWAAFDPKNAKAQYELAEMYAENGQWRDALTAIGNACGIDSVNAEIHVLYARACEKNNNENGRLIHLRKAYQYAPDNADVLYELGAFYAGKKQVAAARPLLSRALAIDKMHSGAHFEYAGLLAATNNKDSAYDHFGAAVQIDPFNTAYLVAFAKSAYAVGKRDVAFDYLKKALSRDSTQFEVLQWAGIMYKDAGDARTARALLLKAVVRSSKCASCCKYLADIYFDNGEYDLAVKFYTQSLSVGSYSEAASMGLGNALFLSGDVERAQGMYEKVFSQNPQSQEALYRLCSAYLARGMLDKAKALFAAHQGGRTGGWIHLARGEIAEAGGRVDDAVISYSVASTLMPSNPLSFAGLGRINLMKKNYDKAQESFGKALGNAPHNVAVMLGLGLSYEENGQLPAAFDLYAEVARHAPLRPDVFGRMGRVLSRQQLHEQAIAAFRRGLELSPKNGSLAYDLGNEFRVVLKFKEAIDAYKKSVRNKTGEKRFCDAYKNIGDIYFYDFKDTEKAKGFYRKYLKSGGRDETVVSFVNTAKK